VVVEFREAEVLVGKMAQTVESGVDIGAAVCYGFKEIAQGLFVDVVAPLSFLSCEKNYSIRSNLCGWRGRESAGRAKPFLLGVSGGVPLDSKQTPRVGGWE
jgi:hypothetical protein